MLRLASLLIISCAALAAADITPEQREFFEQKIRPALAENCYACHSSQTMAAAELALDSAPGLLAGGSRGPAITPGDPDASLLLDALSYANLDLQMPPAGKLSDAVIADLRTWIAAGAPDPREEVAAPAVAEAGIDLTEGRKFWAFRPVVKRPPPTGGNPSSPIDAFLLAALQEKGLGPASPADKRSLLRRVTFDLIGLPPTREEIAAFLADDSPGAYQKVVDRLLSSPHYGERWARHWLDLVRYAETNGHEFDNDKPDAWRYRDYVVDAFNQDLPYNVFVKEQIAGDLLPEAEQRLSADGTRYETPIGSGMLWLWEVLNSPTDSVKSRADQVDNQIDVISKSLFGLTVACARCHDHKFDPIPTADYYSMGGVLHSTQLRERAINTPARDRQIHDVLVAQKQADSRARIAAGDAMRSRASDLGQVLRQAAALAGQAKAEESDEDTAEPAPCVAGDSACRANRRVEAFAELLRYAATEPSHPYYPLAKLSEPSQQPFGDRIAEMREEMAAWAAKADPGHSLWSERGDHVYEDFEDGYENWYVDGAAFGDAPTRVSPWSQGLTGRLGVGLANSYAAADAFEGILRSPKFPLDGQYVHIRMAGSKVQSGGSNADLRVTVWANDHPSKNLTADGSGQLKWKSVRLSTDVGRTGYVQITDRNQNGHIVVDRIVLSESAEPPPIARSPYAAVLDLLASDSLNSLDELIDSYRDLAMSLWQQNSEDPELITLREELAGAASEIDGSTLAYSIDVPKTAFAMSSMDVDPHDIRIHLRGNHKNLGEIAPRQFLQIVAGSEQEPVASGSGRLGLARWAASEDNPLTARVMANRIWKHHFGRGIVATPDNFGETGDRPSHPELLDWLASEFMESGWSVKELQRRIVLSETYRMDSAASEQAKQVDPLNTLLSHMPVQRLEAEAIRDSILAVAGTLDRQVGGPSVPPHISEHQDGRGKPETGPLDGEGRRSLYIGVRRNFLPPLFLAFDYPSPMSTIGRRGVSAVPSQALILLNNEFVNQQAAKWAERMLSQVPSRDTRIEEMFEGAFGRLPDAQEEAAVVEFLATQRQSYQEQENGELRAWSDLAHVLINSTEFIFVR